MRLGWLPSTRAGVLGTRGQCYRAQVHQLRPPPPSRRPTTQNTEIGVGFGPEHLSFWAAPERRASPSVWGRLRAVPIWLGAPRPGPGGRDGVGPRAMERKVSEFLVRLHYPLFLGRST
jgi:hypothetical protein